MTAIKGLDVIAVTDHNSCKNCPAVMKLAEQYGILVIPGMELTTAEEVHAVCLFPELSAALDFDRAFTVFHSIFFPGKDNWLFDPVADPVILILPEAFFRNCAIAIVTVLLTVCIVLVVTGRKRPSRRSAPGEGTAS